MSTTVDALVTAHSRISSKLFQPWIIGAVCTSLILSIPMFAVLGSFLFPAGEVWEHLYATVLTDYIVNSFLLMFGVGVMTAFLGIAPAWLITMYKFPGCRFLDWALLLPMAIPAYIIAYTYTGMLDVSGPVQTWIREVTGWQYGQYWFPEVRSLGGAITMLSFVLYPYVYLLARAAFIEQSICVLEVARTLGCGPFKSFFKVALPLARPAIIVGLSLVLMETLADYGTVQYFGIAAFTTGIFRTWFGLGSSVAAAQLSALLLLFIFVLIGLEYWSRKQQRYHHTSTRYSSLTQPILKGNKKRIAVFVCVSPVLLGFVLPVVFLMLWAFKTYSYVVDQSFFILMWHSIILAACAAVLAMSLALFMSYSKRRYASNITRFAVNFSGMGYAIPGTVIAVGVMLPFAWLDNRIDTFFQSYFDVSTGLLLSGTLVALMFAYMVRFLAVSLKTVDAGLNKIHPSIDEVGRSVGMKTFTLIRKVHIPMMRGSILAAALLVFVDVLKELPATLILRPFNFNTLAVRTYELANEERLADASCSALAILLVGIVPVIYLSRTIAKSRPGYDSRT